jgi:hypothetical protein
MACERLLIGVRVSFPLTETGRQFHVNGITVTRPARNVESAEAGAEILVAPGPGWIDFTCRARGRV